MYGNALVKEPLKNRYGVSFRSVRKVAKKKKTTISFFMYVCLSVRVEQLGSHSSDFHKIWYWITFRNSVEKIQVGLKYDIIAGKIS